MSESRGGVTSVVALHGASEGHRAFTLYEHLHTTLPPLGVGVVTFDRRGEGESTGEPSRGRLDLQARDALAVINALEIDNVVVWGFSQGAWVAPLVANACPQVRGVVGIAATGVTPAEQMLYGVAAHMRMAGVDERSIDRVMALRRRFADCMRSTSDDDTLARDLAEASTESWWELAYLPSAIPDVDDRTSWVEEMDYDPLPAMHALTVPTLVVFGRDDEWSPVDASVAAWRRVGPPGVRIVVLDGVGHNLIGDGGQVDSRYERELVDFISEVASRPGW